MQKIALEKIQILLIIEWKEFDKIMTKKNISRKECLLLPLNTTLNALNKKKL